MHSSGSTNSFTFSSSAFLMAFFMLSVLYAQSATLICGEAAATLIHPSRMVIPLFLSFFLIMPNFRAVSPF